jgi:hypothetical protein
VKQPTIERLVTMITARIGAARMARPLIVTRVAVIALIAMRFGAGLMESGSFEG